MRTLLIVAASVGAGYLLAKYFCSCKEAAK
jgi:hypothetical protein